MIDPPWKFRTRSPKVTNPEVSRNVDRHYKVMAFSDLLALPVRDLSAKNAHLFLCTTGPFLQLAFQLIEAYGFRYSAMAFVWIKLRRAHDIRQLRFLPTAEADLHVGLGLTTRKNAEFVLLARRGSPRRAAKNVREVILSPVREHSRKPDELSVRIERYCAGPYLELFARQERPGWTTWGDEVTKFNGGMSHADTSR